MSADLREIRSATSWNERGRSRARRRHRSRLRAARRDGTKGLVIERDGTQGDLNGFKWVFEITLGPPGTEVGKGQVLDLLRIPDPDGISPQDQQAGDVGIGPVFAFPFVTIEDVVVLGPRRIGILNDNNFPGSKGRHLGTGAPDDNEMIIVDLAQPLGTYSELPPSPSVSAVGRRLPDCPKDHQNALNEAEVVGIIRTCVRQCRPKC